MSRVVNTTRPASPTGSPTFRRQIMTSGASSVPADQRERILAEQRRRNAQTPGTFSISNAAASPVSPNGAVNNNNNNVVRRASVPSVQMTSSSSSPSPRGGGSNGVVVMQRPASPGGSASKKAAGLLSPLQTHTAPTASLVANIGANASSSAHLLAPPLATTVSTVANVATPVVNGGKMSTTNKTAIVKHHHDDDCSEEEKKYCEPVECKQSCDHGDGDPHCEHSRCECPMDDCHCDESDCSEDDEEEECEDSKCEYSHSENGGHCHKSKAVKGKNGKSIKSCKTKSAKAKANGLDPLIVSVPQEIEFPSDPEQAKAYKASVIARVRSRLDIHPGTSKLLTDADLATLIDSALVVLPKFSVLNAHEWCIHFAQSLTSVPSMTNTPIARHTIASLLIQSMVEQLYAITVGKVPPSVAVIVSHQLPKLYTALEPAIRAGAVSLAIVRKAELDQVTTINKIRAEVAAQKKARVAAKIKAKNLKATAKAQAKAQAKSLTKATKSNKSTTKDSQEVSAAAAAKPAPTSSSAFCCGKVEDN